jgi:cbb3-type cytochrome oxidase maturation protein
MTIGFLIPLSIGMGLAGLAAFFWALRSGQFSDPEGDACRILIPHPPLQGEYHDRLASHPDHADPSGRL